MNIINKVSLIKLCVSKCSVDVIITAYNFEHVDFNLHSLYINKYCFTKRCTCSLLVLRKSVSFLNFN